ncbi:hypothetical protein KC950_00610 [Candidatus Saccharibacteria bacterium]|nr:hypothetical protein [Candidatus Saccharibacteria bacterium]
MEQLNSTEGPIYDMTLQGVEVDATIADPEPSELEEVYFQGELSKIEEAEKATYKDGNLILG